MQITRKFLVKTDSSPDGVIYTYNDRTELFVGLEIKEENMPAENRQKIIGHIPLTLTDLLSWVKSFRNEFIELEGNISFETFWDKYNDKVRSSRKRSQKLWEKLNKENQAKAYYYIDTYNRHRGNAEKKYCETYLNAELWNN